MYNEVRPAYIGVKHMDYADIFNKIFSKVRDLFIPSQNNDYSPKFLQSEILPWFVVCLLVVKIVSIGIFNIPKSVFFADITRADLVNLLNQKRGEARLGALTEDSKLNQAALLKAQDMVRGNYFAHQSPVGVTPWFWFRKVGYNYKYAGENLAVGFINSDDVFGAWYNSPSHKENLLNPNYRQIGTAVLYGFDGDRVVVVQLFGSLITEKPIAITGVLAKEKNEITESPAGQNPVQQKTISGLGQIRQLTAGAKTIKNSFYAGFINFIVYDYDKLITYISFSLLAVVVISLIVNILVNITVQRGQLIFKSLLLIVILSFVVLVDKNLIGQMIPHQITI